MSNDATTLKVGMIGCGNRGHRHAVGYRRSDRAEIVACADPKEEAVERMAEEFDVPATYSDYHRMLEENELDVVSMALWTGLHYDAVMACIDAGVRLINAEKPMAPTFGESKKMHEACEEAGVMMTFSHQRRFGPTFQRARQMVKDGAVGELIRMEGYCPNLFDWGTHWFDMMFFYNDDRPARWVMGQIDVAEDHKVFDVPVTTHGLSYVMWQNGVTGLLVTGDEMGGECAYGNRLMGTEGIIEVGGRNLRVLREGSEWETPEVEELDEPGQDTVLYILESIECLLTGQESLLSSRKALQATELIFATYESARRRARVPLPLGIEDSPLLSMIESGEITVPQQG